MLLDKHINQRTKVVSNFLLILVVGQYSDPNGNKHPLAMVKFVLAINVKHTPATQSVHAK